MKRVHEDTLRTLLDAGAVEGVHVLGHGRSWYVLIRTGGQDRHLGSARKEYREWRDLGRLARWLRDLGIGRFQVDPRDYRPEQGDLV